MGIIALLKQKLNKKTAPADTVAGVEDFMMLVRVYYQAVIAAQVGITNLSALPDLRTFKQNLKVPTVNNKLGVGEKSKCKRMLQDLYGLSDNFFREIDQSIKRGCKRINDVQGFFFSFQGFSQDLLLALTTSMKWKLRVPTRFKNTLRSFIANEVQTLLTSMNIKDSSVRMAAINLRKYQQTLGYTPEWMTEYALQMVILAKKEPKRNRKASEDDK